MKIISLDDQKQIELDILKYIDLFCRKHSLQYMLTAGTLLGAVRHKGFIPWDDDIDLMMPRNDYEKLFMLFNKEASGTNYRLISYRDKSSIYPFFKIVATNTVVIEDFVDPQYKTGVWIDIFPIDGVNNKRIYDYAKKAAFKHNVAASNAANATTNFRRIFKQFLKVLLRASDPYKIASDLDRAASKTPIEPGNNIAIVVWGYGPQEEMPYEFLESKEFEFEGNSFYGPVLYESYLTQIYGDYMVLPPKDERVPHYVKAYLL